MIDIWTARSFDPELVPEWVHLSYKKLTPYICEFLPSKHPYRNGVVCPFVPKAIKEDELYFTYYGETDIDGADKLITDCIRHYKMRETKTPGSVVIIFRDRFDISSLLKIHIKNKEKCVENFLMLGVLYSQNSAPSLHADDYYPLRTPIPTLVLRDLTASDLIFLDPDHYSIPARCKFLAAFIKRFSANESATGFAALQVESAKKMHSEYLHLRKLQICKYGKITTFCTALVIGIVIWWAL